MLESPSVKTILTGFLTPVAIVLIFAIAWNVIYGMPSRLWANWINPIETAMKHSEFNTRICSRLTPLTLSKGVRGVACLTVTGRYGIIAAVREKTLQDHACLRRHALLRLPAADERHRGAAAA